MKINKNEFADALATVLPGLSKKSDLPQTQSFIFADGEVITFNDRIAIHRPLPEALKELTGAVKAQELYRILLKLPDGCDVDVSLADGKLRLSTKTIKAAVRCEAEIVNPYVSVAVPETLKKIPKGMLEAIHNASFSASTDLSKPVLCHIYCSGKQVISCDNRRITVISLEEETDKMFVPATVSKTLLTYAPVKYGVAEGWAHFENDSGVLFSFRTIAAEFPKVSSFFKDIDKWQKIEFPEGSSEAVDRVATVLDQDLLHPSVDVEFRTGKMIVSGKGPFASVKERIKSRVTDELSFSISAEFFADLLKLHAHALYCGEQNRICLRSKDKTLLHLVCLSIKG